MSGCNIYINQFSAPEIISQTGPFSGIGLDLRGNSNSKIEIGYINGFEKNIYLSTTDINGSWGNKISWGSSIYSKYCFMMTTDGTAKCYNNGNIIYGGQMQGDICFAMIKGGDSQTDRFNGNQLMSGLFEGGTTALSIDFANNNEFHGRIESLKFEKALVTTENCKGGQYFISTLKSKCQIKGIGERFYGNIYDDYGVAIGQYIYTDNQRTLRMFPS